LIGLHVDPALVALPNGLAETDEELQTLIMRGVSVAAWARGCDALTLSRAQILKLPSRIPGISLHSSRSEKLYWLTD